MTRREKMLRRGAAATMTVWLAGWVPSIVYTWNVGNAAQLYAIWIILGPLALVMVGCAAYWLGVFYQWALGRPTHAEVEARIAELEQELNIPHLDERRSA